MVHCLFAVPWRVAVTVAFGASITAAICSSVDATGALNVRRTLNSVLPSWVVGTCENDAWTLLDSVIVPTASASSIPRLPLLSLTLTVSASSTTLSRSVWTVIVFVVSPAWKVSVPLFRV